MPPDEQAALIADMVTERNGLRRETALRVEQLERAEARLGTARLVVARKLNQRGRPDDSVIDYVPAETLIATLQRYDQVQKRLDELTRRIDAC